MNDVSASIEPLVSKLLKVKKRVDSLSEENNSLKQEIADLERKLKSETQRVQAVQGEYDRLKLAKSLVSSSSDKAEMKFRVNELVKEIDRCIALLNR
jgi:chromosome segregation ATPase